MYIGVDLWDKRCWIAIYIEWVVIPKEIVLRANLIKILKKYTDEYNAKVIVVGLPYDLYQKEKKQLEKTKKFIDKLKDLFIGIEVVWVDERFTSYEADNILRELWKNNTEGKKDAISAALILETYLKTK